MRNRPPLLSFLALVLATAAATTFAQPLVWVSSGPADVGTVIDLVAADGVVYAATSGGVYRSTGSGQGWTLAGLRGESVWRIVARPGSPIFALTNMGALYVSRDRGDSWDRLAPSGSDLSVVAIDPQSPSTAYLASYSHILWKTTDGGSSWKRLSSAIEVYGMEFDPRDNSLVILSDGGIKRSVDGGSTFTFVPFPGGLVYTLGASRDPSGSLYAGTENSGGTLSKSRSRAADSGAPERPTPSPTARATSAFRRSPATRGSRRSSSRCLTRAPSGPAGPRSSIRA